ncbi:hypothetical protein ACTA71_006732, partial [Dictyostelium dimigraforme]
VCMNFEWVDSKNVKCTVPPGKGKGLPIKVNVQSQENSPNTLFSYEEPDGPKDKIRFFAELLSLLISMALLLSISLPLSIEALTIASDVTKIDSTLAAISSFTEALEKSLLFGYSAVPKRVVTQVAKNGIKRVSTLVLAMIVSKSSIGSTLPSSTSLPISKTNYLSTTPYSGVYFSINHNDRIFTIDNQYNETVTCIDINNYKVNFTKSFTCQINNSNNGINCNNTINFSSEINCGIGGSSSSSSPLSSFKFSIPNIIKDSSSLNCQYDIGEKSMKIYGQKSTIYCKDGNNQYSYNYNSTIFCTNSDTHSNIINCYSNGGEPSHSFTNNVECFNYDSYSSCSKSSLVKSSDYSSCFQIPPSELQPIIITNQTILSEFNNASTKLTCYPKEVEFNYTYNNSLICYNTKSGSIDYSDSIQHQIQYKVKVCIEKQ